MDTISVTLACFITLSSITTFATNLLVIYVIIKTKRYGKISTIMFYLSVSDCFNAVVGQTLYSFKILSITTNKDINTGMEFVFNFAVLNSFYLVGLLAYDRYLHLKHLMDYANVATVRRFNILLMSTVLYSIITAAFEVAIWRIYSKNYAILIFSSPVMLLVMWYYVKSLKILRKNEQNSYLDGSKKSTMKIAALVFLSIFIFFIPGFVALVIHSINDYLLFLKDRIVNVFVESCRVFNCFNATFNALVFLSVDTKAKRLIGIYPTK